MHVYGERPRLNKGAVPSIFPFALSLYSNDFLNDESPRCLRKKNREGMLATNDQHASVCTEVQSVVEVKDTPEIQNSSSIETPEEDLHGQFDQSVQCELKTFGKFSVKNFENDPKMIKYYTGFCDFEQFIFFFNCLGPCVSELSHQTTLMDPKDQLFMVLMKLRQAKEDVELALFFGISESSVSRIFNTRLNFMYYQLKELCIWPSKDIIQQFMPSDFGRKFPNTRVILDATELPINKPSDVNAQSITWSAYKHKNTMKTMIGCTPKGAVSFVSKAYGGSANDRQIIENSELLNPDLKMFEKGDSVMADRGIMVQDLFASQDVYVNTPTMLKGKSQLDPQEVIRDRRVASKRIHIERVIGLSKGFKILRHPLPQSKLHLGSRIVFVCFSLSNFRKSIVDRNA
ncbi:uncharacterized protein LOC128173672 isoform X2 [Crassostrea angulata]|uniref:uncharacterized protein LOC128173672 isoform X2 n=1 Tax=Magallana angulata TaxID=2784310 RepID=UPI0022B1EF97|nr:uncharacterized protein LOC128173672 isoform X2 [Crassostrea angulata]